MEIKLNKHALLKTKPFVLFPPGGGGTPGKSCRGVPPGSPNPDPISDQKMPFSRPVFRPRLQAEIMLVLLRLECQQRNSSNSVRFSNSHISLSSLLIWSWNGKYVHTLPLFPRKPSPIPDQNGQSVYPFSNQNGAKTLPDGTANTAQNYTRTHTRWHKPDTFWHNTAEKNALNQTAPPE